MCVCIVNYYFGSVWAVVVVIWSFQLFFTIFLDQLTIAHHSRVESNWVASPQSLFFSNSPSGSGKRVVFLFSSHSHTLSFFSCTRSPYHSFIQIPEAQRKKNVNCFLFSFSLFSYLTLCTHTHTSTRMDECGWWWWWWSIQQQKKMMFLEMKRIKRVFFFSCDWVIWKCHVLCVCVCFVRCI